MKDASRRFLESLIRAISPSGYEEEAARVWQAEARGIATAVRHDVHGNSHAVINPGGAPRVLLAGHCDEIGFVVSHIDDNGFLWIQPIGGWDPQIPQGHRVVIRGRKGRVKGVLGKMPVHLLKPEDRDKVTKLERLWVDIGAGSRKEAQKRVAIGDPLVLDHELAELTDKILVGRGFDNRIGAFIVLEVLRRLSKTRLRAEVHAVATVQEEIGIRGARTAAFGIDPQIGIATDVTFATDHPTMDEAVKRFGKISLGGGPVVSRGPNVHPRLFERLVQTAERQKIPHQIEAHGGPTPTDANLIQVSRAGVITALVSTPCRYLHSSCELIHLDDVDAEIELIAETVAGLRPDTDFSLLR
ncbi:MAG: M42 family metallopeptidase [Kiritimatiellae bacterium]|nr:M42 family metallopeptidase [Kiritimatiellia bacterium]